MRIAPAPKAQTVSNRSESHPSHHPTRFRSEALRYSLETWLDPRPGVDPVKPLAELVTLTDKKSFFVATITTRIRAAIRHARRRTDADSTRRPERNVGVSQTIVGCSRKTFTHYLLRQQLCLRRHFRTTGTRVRDGDTRAPPACERSA